MQLSRSLQVEIHRERWIHHCAFVMRIISRDAEMHMESETHEARKGMGKSWSHDRSTSVETLIELGLMGHAP